MTPCILVERYRSCCYEQLLLIWQTESNIYTATLLLHLGRDLELWQQSRFMEFCCNTVQSLGYERCFWWTMGVKGVDVEAEKGKEKMWDFRLRPPDDSRSFLGEVIDRDYYSSKKGTSTAQSTLTLKHCFLSSNISNLTSHVSETTMYFIKSLILMCRSEKSSFGVSILSEIQFYT